MLTFVNLPFTFFFIIPKVNTLKRIESDIVKGEEAVPHWRELLVDCRARADFFRAVCRLCHGWKDRQ